MNIFIDDGRNHILTKRMLPYWKEDGHNIVDSSRKADIHLTYVKFDHSSSLPKVLRLDGVYYDAETNYKKRNHLINVATRLTNGIIYQSIFSKLYCEQYLSNTNRESIIIYNGIEPGWCGDHEETKDFNIVVSASWRRWKRLKEITQIFLKFFSRHSNAKLHVIGKADCKITHKNVFYYNYISHNDMIPILKKANVSLNIAKRDWCPNALLEILGVGIPVITTDACGGVTEIAEFIQGCIICRGEKNDQEFLYQYTENYNKLAYDVEDILLKALEIVYQDRRKIILPDIFSIKHVANEYIRFMQKFLC